MTNSERRGSRQGREEKKKCGKGAEKEKEKTSPEAAGQRSRN
jgi:hypothetical protein